MKFGASYGRRSKGRQADMGGARYLDEVFVRIDGPRRCLRRAEG